MANTRWQARLSSFGGETIGSSYVHFACSRFRSSSWKCIVLYVFVNYRSGCPLHLARASIANYCWYSVPYCHRKYIKGARHVFPAESIHCWLRPLELCVFRKNASTTCRREASRVHCVTSHPPNAMRRAWISLVASLNQLKNPDLNHSFHALFLEWLATIFIQLSNRVTLCSSLRDAHQSSEPQSFECQANGADMHTSLMTVKSTTRNTI